jgi:pyruvate dehydrogenase E1 component beta subunit
MAARIMEECFDRLEAPVARVTGYDTPYPPPVLDAVWWPSVERIAAAALETVRYPSPPG